MQTFDFDLVVLGAGSGGVRAARVAASYGARVAICEGSRVGGTCVIRGCVPKKLLTYAAHFSEDFSDAAGFGWTVPKPEFSWPALIAAKDQEIDRLNRVYIHLLEKSGVRIFHQHAEFTGPHSVRVGDHTFSAERILIATGGRPWKPEIPGNEWAITSDEVFHLEELPPRVLVVGGGYIACEFAGIFGGLGSSVTQAYRGDTLLRGFDHDVGQSLVREMTRKDIEIRLQRNVVSIQQQKGTLQAKLDDGKIIEVDLVLFATGRVPNVRNLGIEHSGVAMHPAGAVLVDEYSRTNVPHVFAVGDVTNRKNLTPVAIYEAQAFADTVFGGLDRPVRHEYVPSAVFSQPPVGSVGYGEEAAQTHFGAVDVYRTDFRPLKNTLSGRADRTMMKLIVAQETQKVVGIHIVGNDAPEIVQGFAIAVKSGLTKEQFDGTLGIHPTAAEELVTLRHPIRSSGQGRG